ncbi:hypothetical protein M0R79_03320 [Ignavigranum ruoffiae]|uniref:hypothetical protein n=1 Tax=Ignavigranum ruoffiae TaxID=89093 RepID=UPI0020514809|nr:hypothetical protein [Ignavigranum ruoffiae]UPQ86415.1 hypothetical protein M0R79_03320 [Ignavigranum ruoffiae]
MGKNKYEVIVKDYPENLDYGMTEYEIEVESETMSAAIEIVEVEYMPAGGVTRVRLIERGEQS